MAVKWIWGFESGADKSFYSGSGWVESITRFSMPEDTDLLSYPSELSFDNGTEACHDFSHNFPHQPPTSVGGGSYCLKTTVPSARHILNSGSDLGSYWANWPNYSVFTPVIDPLGSSASCFSFSFQTSVDSNAIQTVTQLGPGTQPPNIFFEHIISIYPYNQAPGMGNDFREVNSSVFGGPLVAITENIQSGSLVHKTQPLMSLYNFSSASVSPTVRVNKILALCYAPPIAVADPIYDFFYSFDGGSVSNSDVDYSLLSMITASIAAGPSGFSDFYAYTSSDGQRVMPNEWTQISMFYNPKSDSTGDIKVYLDGVNCINQVNVQTGYTASLNLATLTASVNQAGWRLKFSSTPFCSIPDPRSLCNLPAPNIDVCTIDPPTHYYDHVVVFDSESDLAAATSSIFIDRFIPDQDISTGSYVGNDSGTADLYDYIDDTNYYLNNSYLRTDNTASDRELKVSTTGIYETKAGHPTWSVGNISEIIGLNSINLVSSSADLGLYGTSLMWDAGLANNEITGPYSLVSGKKFIESVSGETALGASWNYLTGNSGGGPGSQILHSGFKFGPLPESYTVTLAGGNLRFDSWASEISMFIKESGSGDILVTWPGGAALNDPVTWTWNTADALKDFVSGDTYYLDIQENIGDNFFFGASSSSISFTVENDEISSGFTDPVPTNVGDLFLNISHTVGEAARFYFIYNGTSSAPTNPTPGTSGERYGP